MSVSNEELELRIQDAWHSLLEKDGQYLTPAEYPGQRLITREELGEYMADAAFDEDTVAKDRDRVIKLELLLLALANAADDVGVAHFDTDDMPADVTAMQEATKAARAAL